MTEATIQQVKCRNCERAIDICEFCDEGNCEVPVCFECLRVATRESLHEAFVPEPD
jgi:hypothetical protein